jgi:hypothetical protein
MVEIIGEESLLEVCKSLIVGIAFLAAQKE